MAHGSAGELSDIAKYHPSRDIVAVASELY